MKNVWYQLKRLGKASLEETMCFLRGEEGWHGTLLQGREGTGFRCE